MPRQMIQGSGMISLNMPYFDHMMMSMRLKSYNMELSQQHLSRGLLGLVFSAVFNSIVETSGSFKPTLERSWIS